MRVPSLGTLRTRRPSRAMWTSCGPMCDPSLGPMWDVPMSYRGRSRRRPRQAWLHAPIDGGGHWLLWTAQGTGYFGNMYEPEAVKPLTAGTSAHVCMLTGAQACMQARKHASTQARKHASVHTNTRTYARSHAYARTHARIHTRTCMDAYRHACMHTCTNPCARIRMQPARPSARTHARTHACTHTYVCGTECSIDVGSQNCEYV